MTSILDEFRFRRSLLVDMHANEAGPRLSGFLYWLHSSSETIKIVRKIEETINAEELLNDTEEGSEPNAEIAEEIVAVGVFLISKCGGVLTLADIGRRYNITPNFGELRYSDQEMTDEVIIRYIGPTLEYIELELEKIEEPSADDLLEVGRSSEKYPLEITESLQKFLTENPDTRRNAFVMMQFGDTTAHDSIMKGIRKVLTQYEIKAFRADEKDYHDDLFPNVLTYIYGCDFGIAVFERLQDETFNPNVSLEMGYMRALKKSICLLKDKTLTTLQSDLGGILYKEFDTQDAEGTIPDVLEKWLRDRDIITG